MRSRCRTAWTVAWAAGLLALGAATTAVAAGPADGTVPATRLWWFENLADWRRSPGNPTGTVEFEGPAIDPPFRWAEAVVSWNAPTHVALEVVARPAGAPSAYSFGVWSADTNAAPRTSIAGQRDAWGHVDTDTLVAHAPAGSLRLAVRVRRPDGAAVEPTGIRIGVSLLAADGRIPEPASLPAAWGRQLAVPVHSQADFPEGVQNWCSPTSLTMLLAWWRGHGVPGIAGPGVRQTAAGVDDPGWPGTGNWPFNTAFAGQQPGLSACVARLAGIGDLEAWIADGKPVAASVSYSRLKGAAEASPGDGHLVVVTGFTPTGDVRVNDPGVRRSRVAAVVPRADFARAWAHSRRTVYLVWPTALGRPAGGDGRW